MFSGYKPNTNARLIKHVGTCTYVQISWASDLAITIIHIHLCSYRDTCLPAALIDIVLMIFFCSIKIRSWLYISIYFFTYAQRIEHMETTSIDNNTDLLQKNKTNDEPVCLAYSLNMDSTTAFWSALWTKMAERYWREKLPYCGGPPCISKNLSITWA